MSPRYVMCPECDGGGFVDEDGDPCDKLDLGACKCQVCGGSGEMLEGEE